MNLSLDFPTPPLRIHGYATATNEIQTETFIAAQEGHWCEKSLEGGHEP